MKYTISKNKDFEIDKNVKQIKKKKKKKKEKKKFNTTSENREQKKTGSDEQQLTYEWYPSCRQATLALLSEKESSQTVPHLSWYSTSSRPSPV